MYLKPTLVKKHVQFWPIDIVPKENPLSIEPLIIDLLELYGKQLHSFGI